jgi:F0F1-type ATP synthase alpha subunit
MNTERYYQVEKIINSLQEQIYGKEDTLATIAPEEKVRIKQQIKDLRSELHPFEKERWQILAAQVDFLDIDESEAGNAIVEIIQQVEVQEKAFPEQAMVILLEIKDQLKQLDKPAAAKLKGIISSIPPFIGISYEAELDTENFFQKYCPTFTALIKKASKKNFPDFS